MGRVQGEMLPHVLKSVVAVCISIDVISDQYAQFREALRLFGAVSADNLIATQSPILHFQGAT